MGCKQVWTDLLRISEVFESFARASAVAQCGAEIDLDLEVGWRRDLVGVREQTQVASPVLCVRGRAPRQHCQYRRPQASLHCARYTEGCRSLAGFPDRGD